MIEELFLEYTMDGCLVPNGNLVARGKNVYCACEIFKSAM